MLDPAIRNVALVTHVDHGKTTLVDTILRQTGTFAEHAALVDRVKEMVAGDLDIARREGAKGRNSV